MTTIEKALLAFCCTLAVITALGCAVSVTVGVCSREAVAAGHAEFVADKEGNVEFKWKEACK